MTAVIVVGAGLLGASVAEALAHRGAAVTIVERDEPGEGTSGATFAWLNAQDKSPDAYFDLNVAGMREHLAVQARLGGDWIRDGGDLLIGRGPGLDKARERIQRHQARGYPVKELDRPGVLALEPNLVLGDEPLVAGHFTADAWIDATAMARALVASARRAGAGVVTATVAEPLVADGRVAGVRLVDGGELRGDVVVLAAGPASGDLAARAGVHLPMAPSPGLLVTVGPVMTTISRMIHAGPIAIRPDGLGRILLSSRDVDATLDPATRALDVDAPAVAELVSRASRLLPEVAAAPVERVRVGIRSVAQDGQPATGVAADRPGLYLLVSHSGATLAPILGRLVAGELLGEPAPELEPYRPDRFGTVS
jgi:glycine/D-amino acid oxidase-like deaminating enzyme